jgi:hypothetical protein
MSCVVCCNHLPSGLEARRPARRGLKISSDHAPSRFGILLLLPAEAYRRIEA